ncbi:hypothetical protein N7G274_002305 [Stereocaulon virgatum]|uniref:Pre-mRNA-splicing factor SPF27 n=1 Tax=Stereocaulon virgatum TaxID=373712 RepID=A0ABR4AHG5_9LECA
MPLITASHDSLPYIERPPTPNSSSTAHALIKASLSPSASSHPHPLLPDPPRHNPLPPLIQSELSRVAAKKPISGIDLTRYEASAELDASTSLASAREALKAAYTNASYLTMRLQALALLERFGKNAWLVGNSQLEDILRDVERELVQCRGRVEGINRERKAAQERGRGVLEGAEREWRSGVAEVVEVLGAVAGVERECRVELGKRGRWGEG